MNAAGFQISARPFAVRLLMISIPCVLLTIIGSVAIYRQYVLQQLEEVKRAQENVVALQSESIRRDFGAIVTDLSLLSRSATLKRALDVQTDEAWQAVERELVTFSQVKQIYDQVRCLDPEGNEIVRVNYGHGQAKLVPKSELQSKSTRYYFRNAKGLREEEIFVSTFDLNIENGLIDQPWKPTVRLASPVFDSHDTLGCVVVLNYLGDLLLARFKKLHEQALGEPMWLNAEGYWLHAADSTRTWGFMFPSKKEIRFSRFYPAAWHIIANHEQGCAETPEGVFTFQSVHPLSVADAMSNKPSLVFDGSHPYTWKIVSHVAPSVWHEQYDDLRRTAVAIGLLTVGAVIAACAGVTWYSLSRRAWTQSLSASEARFRQMADSIAEVFWLSAADRNRFFYVNPAFKRIWGRDPDLDQIGGIWRDSVHSQDRSKLDEINSAVARQRQFSVQYRILRADGTIRWIWDQGFPVEDHGRITRYAGIAEDITDLREAQERLLQSERLAAVGEAITGLAHESRNALQRSQACLEMLLKRIHNQPEALSLAQRGQTALSELNRLYERLRGFAAPVTLEYEGVSLRDVWESAARDLQQRIDRHSVTISHSGRCSPAETYCQVDELAIRQVFRNLVDNAIDSVLESHEATAPQIEVDWSETTWQQQPAIRMLVRDNGPGVDPRMREKIFAPFTTGKANGTGLGLSIARRLVEAHHGKINVTERSSQTLGCEIEILLPRSKTCNEQV
jgi:PAS domain S-box-containing protein